MGEKKKEEQLCVSERIARLKPEKRKKKKEKRKKKKEKRST